MFYDRFIELCKLKGVQPAKIARDLGLNQSTVSMWKSRGTTPNAVTVVQLAEYLDVDANWLTHGKTLEERDAEYKAKATKRFDEAQDELLRVTANIENKTKQLNYRGRARLSDYADELVEIPEYKTKKK